MTFEPASSAADAEWVAEALRSGNWTRVSAVIPNVFEAYAVLRHSAQLCVCTEENIAAFQSGRYHNKDWDTERLRWSQVAETDLPVVYGRTAVDGVTRDTQYRRLPDGKWVRDILANGGLSLLIRAGDEWIEGPEEGGFEPELARSLQAVLARFTASPDPCWYGIWEGWGFLSKSQRRAPAIDGPGRRWHLFRAPLANMDQSFFPDTPWHHPANLVWPQDRSWCVATEIDLEATYVGGSEELIAAVLNEPAFESERVNVDDSLAMLRDLLQPVVEKPPGAKLREGFEAREYPRELRDFKPPLPKSWRERFFHWLLTLRWRLFRSKYEFRAYTPPKKKS